MRRAAPPSPERPGAWHRIVPAVERAALALLCASALPDRAASQAPGYPPVDPRAVRAEYTAEVLDRINDVLADWGEAWGRDDVDELVDQYWEDATLIPRGRTPLRGREQIRAYFEEVVPRHGHVEAFMLDFDASGGMAVVYGNYMIGIQQGQRAGSQETGPLVTVYAMRGRTWRIRTQVFVVP